MNHCQNEYSCISCCGIFNFQLSLKKIQKLLLQRKKDFIPSQDRKVLIQYREKRESLENQITINNREVYICPFCGYLPNGRFGCMIHPSLTYDERSQDVSFYGSSICKSYDCRVKEEDSKQDFLYLKILLKILKQIRYNNSDIHFIYSRLVADYIFFRFSQTFFHFESIYFNNELLELYRELCELRLNTRENQNVTSFEINYFSFVYTKENQISVFQKLFQEIFGVYDEDLHQRYHLLLKGLD